jgi:lysophospholipase L1-like esterase
VGGDFVAPIDGDYAIIIQSQDASSLMDKVDEVASQLFITRAGSSDSGGSGSGENNGTDVVVPSGDTFTFVNLVDNSKDSNFSGQSGVLTHEDGWHKMSPSGSNAYPRINYFISEQLQAGHKYLVAYTMKYDLGNITANGAFPRLVSGGTTLTGNFDLKWLTGKRYFAVNRCACVFECETTLRYTLEMMIGYANASDAAGTWYAVKDINVIDITDMEEIPEPYHLGNMILAQSNGLISEETPVDPSKETLFPLQNHTILFMGDSIFGNYNVPKYVSDISKAKTINGAIGGTTATWYNPSLTLTESLVSLSESIKTGDWSAQAASTKEAVARLRELDFNAVNDLVIEIGTNDWRRCAEIGEDNSTDIATFKGALNTIIGNILTAYPEIDIYLLTPLFRTEFGNSNTTPNDSGVYLYDFADAMIDIARKYGIPVYDMYHHGGINEYNHTKYLSDGTHPLPIMRMKIAKIINDLIVY